MTATEQSASSQQRKSHDPLLDQSGFAVERLPMLGVIFDRFVGNLIEGLRVLCRTATAFSVEEIATANLFAVLKASKGSVGAVLHSPELDARSLVIVDEDFVLSLIQILMGGDASEQPEQSKRPYTKIELNLLQKISELAARSLHNAFAGIVEASFKLERQEPLVDTTILGRRDAPVVVARILFHALGLSGKMTVVIPQTALLPIRQKLSREPPGESSAADPRWTRQMQNGVSHAEIPVKGVLEEIPMTLGEIAAMEVGHVLQLHGSGMGRVRLECGEHDLFWCKLSQTEGRYTLEIEEPILEKRDILEDILLT
ncbi:MAG: FliM/FliN family flagellar motor switch protein [Roseiarcus sp.]|jgi:flagellar motor switch protein FliM